jgi:multicomponent Na+:H+ antiporter subunit F
MNGAEVLHWAMLVAGTMLMVAIILAFVRLMRGPSLPDRVVALDLTSTLSLGIIAAFAVASGETVYLDVGIVLALIAFLGTVAFARYLEKRTLAESSPSPRRPAHD